jgi:membrane protease YdiL (CAAX protease family)
MKIKTFLKHISPFNDCQETPAAFYVIKKMLAFFLVYGVGAVIGGVLITGVLCAMGVDPMSGDMTSGHLVELSTYYGFATFGLAAALYCRLIEKRDIKSMGFNSAVLDYIVGAVAAGLLLAAIVGVCCATGALRFVCVTSAADAPYLLALFFAFFIQSMAEETLCRGFLFKSLSRKVSMPLAIFVSATAFAIPHLGSVLEADAWFAVIGVLNLYLVSVVFSLLYALRANIYVVGGLHCLWNFVLNGVMGLSVSGSAENGNALLRFQVPAQNILNGGVYGLEASIVTTFVLGITAAILVILCHKRRIHSGIQ